MKRYSFRLANVARIRALEENAAKDHLVAAIRALHLAKEMEVHALAELEALELPKEVTAISEIRWIGDQAVRLHESLHERHNLVVNAETTCDEVRQQWREAKKRSEVLSRLENKHLALWRYEEQREETSELDDLTTARSGIEVQR